MMIIFNFLFIDFQKKYLSKCILTHETICKEGLNIFDFSSEKDAFFVIL